MYDWIIEADIIRYQRALTDITDRQMRDRIARLLGQARSRLFEASIAATRARQQSIQLKANAFEASDAESAEEARRTASTPLATLPIQ